MGNRRRRPNYRLGDADLFDAIKKAEAFPPDWIINAIIDTGRGSKGLPGQGLGLLPESTRLASNQNASELSEWTNQMGLQEPVGLSMSRLQNRFGPYSPTDS